MPRRRPAEDRLLSRLSQAGIYHTFRGIQRVIGALPARWMLRMADLAGLLLNALDDRGRRVSLQNLQTIYGDALTPKEREDLALRSIQGATRAVAVLGHAAPLSPERFRRWVDIAPEDEATLKASLGQLKGAVIVTGHIGSWEMLLGLACLFPGAAPVRFLAETTFHPGVDRFLAYVRGSTGATSQRRAGGARALNSHLRRGGLVGLVMDRNARRQSGGIWAPFLGLDARTSPLPALMARRNDVPIAPIFCLPQPDGRYRIRLYPEPSMDVRTDDVDADVLEITRRLNAILDEVIREHPAAWNWVLKRFKSRPTKEQGPYPPYSQYDP